MHTTRAHTLLPERSARVTAQSCPSASISGSGTHTAMSPSPLRGGASGGEPSARSLSTTTRLSRWASPRSKPRASCTAPSRSVARSDGSRLPSVSVTAAMLVVDPSTTRAGAPASTMATSSPAPSPAVSSRAAESARAQRVAPLGSLARMLSESSSTIASATDAPDRRVMASREQWMNGVAPRTARPTTAAARTRKSARSSSRLRRRAAGGVGGTRRAGGKGRSSAWRRRRRCATTGAMTRSAIASADPVRKLIAAPPRLPAGWSGPPPSPGRR